MKHYFTLLLLIFSIYAINAQEYKFGIIHESGNAFKVVFIPDFNSFDSNTSDGIVDISDVGFTLMLPAGISEIQNVISLLTGRTWNLNSYDADFLIGQGLGDGTKDAFLLTMNPGQSIYSHVATAQIDLVSFEVVNPPAFGELYFLENTDPIAQGAGNVLDSFFNADIDGIGNGAGTIDYYGGNDPTLNSFSFSTLSIPDSVITNLDIFPNPVSKTLYITTNQTLKSVLLYNILGKQVYSSKDSNQIEVDGYQQGIYLLKIETNQGVTTKKIIIN
ncbi:T9SS type A sorting domain-containing protein [Winogradskyella ouciana]|uniref:T9SS type A sorting domain-containing protein n=1 Tax=Winogradskyella ouciana TaxID=2608631 RepID=A0A7K1GAK3_9FLAO|nr:T9SS type A sorting domain-containing protein [Winogradskyella ouciana]MTE26065.1 T9SS type A sorting domain-containing protein [Winogradskyella ouciana]